MASERRERFRRQTREEAKALALVQLAESGTAGISVNAIAKQMGMTGPALYRYFAGRDELLTELITDAYRDLAEAVRTAVDGAAPGDRLAVLARTLRDWARREPDRYLLIYGTPVPGYQAPPESTEIAGVLMRSVLDACAGEGAPSGAAGRRLAEEAGRARPWAPGSAEDGVVKSRALRVWARLHGVISLELQGQFAGMGFDPSALFEAEVESLERELAREAGRAPADPG